MSFLFSSLTGKARGAMKADPILAEVDGEAMIIDVDKNTSYFLNETALFLYKMKKAGKSPDAMKAALIEAYDVEEKMAEQDIREFMAKMDQKMAER